MDGFKFDGGDYTSQKYLVAPVLEKGIEKRAVVFPDGKWRDMADGKVYDGGRYEVNAPLINFRILRK